MTTRAVRLCVALLAPWLGLGSRPAEAGAQRLREPGPVGLYVLPNGSPIIIWSPAEGRLAFAYGAGEVRGLAGDGDLRTYGPSLGVTEPVRGRLRFLATEGTRVPRVAWTDGITAEVVASRIALVEEAVEFQGGGVTLAGTIVVPATPGKHPAVLFTHGSGVESRESSRILAYLLAYHGIASLIYDKRGSGASGGSADAPFADLARDAIAGLALLAHHPRIRPDRIGLFGPSQGAWVSLQAAGSSDVAFVVLQSGDATSPLEQEMYRGETTLRMVANLSETDAHAATAFRRRKFMYAISDSGRAEYEQALAEARTTSWFRYVGDKLPNLAFWRPNGLFNPLPLLEALRQPVLAVFGAKDASKNVEENARLMKAAFAQGRNPDATVTIIPNANHGLFETRTGLPLERELPSLSRMAPGYLETLVAWLIERTR